MQKERRWKLVALLASGMAIGVVMVGTPAGAHVSGWAHNWRAHIKPKADIRYVNERELLWAVVNEDATIARGNGVLSARTDVVPANYVVTFDRNVRNCVYVASIGLSGDEGVEDPGFIAVVAANVDERAVYVTTDDTSGANSPRGFHLLVDCGRVSSPAVAGGPSVDGDGSANAKSG